MFKEIFTRLIRHLPSRLVHRDPLPGAQQTVNTAVPPSLSAHCLKMTVMPEEELWKTLVQKYHELQTIKQDYVENEKYFHNLAIIEGIRNSIAHGNIQILNATETENFHDVKIRFTDMEDEKIVFQLTVSLYELECLFEPCNINVINQYRKTKGV